MRSRSLRATLIAVTALGLLPLAAAPASATPKPEGPLGKVTITVHQGEDSTGKVLDSAKLNCFPMRGSTHPRPYLSCYKLMRAGGDFAKLKPASRPCTLDYRPVTVVAHGTWKGQLTGFARTYGNRCAAHAESGDVFNLKPWKKRWMH